MEEEDWKTQDDESVFRVLTMNIWYQNTVAVELVRQLGPDVVSVQECKGVLHVHGYQSFASGDAIPSEDHPRGNQRQVIVLLRDDLADAAEVIRQVPNREVWVRTHPNPISRGKPLVIGGLHLQPDRPRDHARGIVAWLRERQRTGEREEDFILAGDFNICMTEEQVIEVEEGGFFPSPGLHQTDLAKLFNIAEVLVGKYVTAVASWIGPKGPKRGIDLVAGPGLWANNLIDTHTMPMAPADHFPVMATWNRRVHKLERVDQTPRFTDGEVMRMAKELKETIQKRVAEEIGTPDNIARAVAGPRDFGVSVDALYEKLTGIIVGAGKDIDIFKRRGQSFSLKAERYSLRKRHPKVKTAWEERRKALGKMRRRGVPDVEMRQLWVQATEAKERLHEAIHEALESDMNAYLLQYENDMRQNLRAFYPKSRSLGGGMRKHLRRPTSLQNSDGVLVHGIEAVRVIKDHMSTIVRARDFQNEEWERRHQGYRASLAHVNVNWDGQTQPPSLEDVEFALKHTEASRAGGMDGLIPRVWKLAAEVPTFRARMLKVFQQVWQTGAVPKEWRMGVVIPIPKRGDLSLVGNWRGITLLAVASKVMCRIVSDRLRAVLEPARAISPEQAGFRTGRCCQEQIGVLMEVLQRRRQIQKDTFLCFVDIRQAYDSTHPAVIFTALHRLGIPQQCINLILALRDGEQCVRVGGEFSDVYSAQVGVRQGCTLSPLIFILTMESLIEKLSEDASFGVDATQLGVRLEMVKGANGQLRSRLSSLWYADDGVLIADSISVLQRMVTCTQDWMIMNGFQLSVSKCKVMHVQRGNQGNATVAMARRNEEIHITEGGPALEWVERFLYLGVNVDRTADLRTCADGRLGALYGKLKEVKQRFIRNRKLSPLSKIRFIKGEPERAGLYSSEVWAQVSTINRHPASKTLKRMMQRCLFDHFGHTHGDVLQEETRGSDLVAMAEMAQMGFIFRWWFETGDARKNTWMYALLQTATGRHTWMASALATAQQKGLERYRDDNVKGWQDHVLQLQREQRRERIGSISTHSVITRRYAELVQVEDPEYKTLILSRVGDIIGHRLLMRMRTGTFMHVAWATRRAIVIRNILSGPGEPAELQPATVSHKCIVCQSEDEDDSVDHALWQCTAHNEARQTFLRELRGVLTAEQRMWFLGAEGKQRSFFVLGGAVQGRAHLGVHKRRLLVQCATKFARQVHNSRSPVIMGHFRTCLGDRWGRMNGRPDEDGIIRMGRDMAEAEIHGEVRDHEYFGMDPVGGGWEEFKEGEDGPI